MLGDELDDPDLGYELDDPKRPGYVDELLDH